MNHTIYKTRSLFTLTFMFLLSIFTQQSHAQDMTGGTSFSRHSVFLELGGNALAYSINYDYRFLEHVSARLGVEYFGLNNSGANGSVFLMPLMVNYLTGTGSSHFEVGAGPLIGVVGGGFRDIGETVAGVPGFTGTLGYRLQPRDGGFHFRIGITPVFVGGLFLPWAGIGFGASF